MPGPAGFRLPRESGAGSSAGPVPRSTVVWGPAPGNPAESDATFCQLVVWNNRGMQSIAILGDIHGDSQRMLELVGDLDHEVPLVVLGDYFDRWDHAVEAIQWLMSRPNTTALMGNHDALILGVVEERLRGVEGRNTENWHWNGGKDADLARLMREPEVMDWIRNLPAMTMVGDALIQHCDSPVYLNYGTDLDAINESVRRRVHSRDPEVFFHLFADLCKRRQFYSLKTLRQYIDVFHAKRLIHGHTPHTQPQAISMFHGAIVNVDGALSRGFGPEARGFVHWLAVDGTDATEVAPGG